MKPTTPFCLPKKHPFIARYRKIHRKKFAHLRGPDLMCNSVRLRGWGIHKELMKSLSGRYHW